MTLIELPLREECIPLRVVSLPVATAFCLLLVAGCDIAPPSPSAPPATEPPVTVEPQPAAQAMPSPWDLSWVPEDSQAVASRIDSILEGAGLSGHGAAILEYAREYGVNPAFALAMFKKEAEFAKRGSIAYRQNNPGNIICGGGTTPLYGATGCGGRFGTYDTMADGIRAYFWLLDSEYKPGRKYDCEDIPCIIAVYCPPSNCDTARYVDQVTEWTIQYQNLLSAGGLLVLEPGPTIPSIANTIAPATVVRETPTPTALKARPSLPGGRIAFASNRQGDFEIYVMNADGSELARLTNDLAFDATPSWSPGGTRVAFASDRDGNVDIYVMNADGSDVRRLTSTTRASEWPCWSSDGTRIAFASSHEGGWEIYVVSADGGGLTRLTDSPGRNEQPTWSPDGRRIAFNSTRDGNDEIYVMEADGGNQTNLTNSQAIDAYPSFSPDGQRIAFVSTGQGTMGVYVMNADGGEVTRLTDTSSWNGYPSWSPDGSQLAFVSSRDGNNEIYRMNLDGTGVTRLTDNPAEDLDSSWCPG